MRDHASLDVDLGDVITKFFPQDEESIRVKLLQDRQKGLLGVRPHFRCHRSVWGLPSVLLNVVIERNSIPKLPLLLVREVVFAGKPKDQFDRLSEKCMSLIILSILRHYSTGERGVVRVRSSVVGFSEDEELNPLRNTFRLVFVANPWTKRGLPFRLWFRERIRRLSGNRCRKFFDHPGCHVGIDVVPLCTFNYQPFQVVK